jgi:hypothetical protein
VDTSAWNHGAHAFTSRVLGDLWMRTLPDGVHLKCFTTFVT